MILSEIFRLKLFINLLSNSMKNYAKLFASVALALACLFPVVGLAAGSHVNITTATGGGAISADDSETDGWTNISGPSYSETDVGLIGSGGDIVLQISGGYEFSTDADSVTATVSSGGCHSGNPLLLSGSDSITITPTSNEIHAFVTQSSGGSTSCKATVTFSGIKVHPTSGNVGTSHIQDCSTVGISGVSCGTNLGNLTEVAGAASQIGFSQEPSSIMVLNQSFSQNPTVAVEDQFGNVVTSNNSETITISPVLASDSITAGNGTLSYSSPTTSPATVINGVVHYSGMQYSVAEGIQILATSDNFGTALSDAINVTTPTVVTPSDPTTVPADNVGGAFVPLASSPYVTEGSSGEIGTGTIVLTLPDGFEFDTGSTVSAVVSDYDQPHSNCDINDDHNGNHHRTLLLNGSNEQDVNPDDATHITFNVTRDSTGDCRQIITFNGITVRPTIGSPLPSGNITNTGSAVMDGPDSSTNYGTLNAPAGDPSYFRIIPPESDCVVNIGCDITVELDDQFGNRTDASGQTVVLAVNDGSSANGAGILGIVDGQATATITDGVIETVTFTLVDPSDELAIDEGSDGDHGINVDFVTGDSVPPTTTITSHSKTSTSATFGFTGHDNLDSTDDLTFECSLDSSNDEDFVACDSNPITYDGLSHGSHTFYVRAVDTSGNKDATPAHLSVSIGSTGGGGGGGGGSSGGSIVSSSGGCTGTNGYNTVTGAPCSSGGGNSSAGCAPGALYSSTTGQSCSSGGNSGAPTGCENGASYNIFTGASCFASGPGASSNSGAGSGSSSAPASAPEVFIPEGSGSSPSSAFGPFTVNLRLGYTGPYVVALQQYLISAGLLTVPVGIPLGKFGNLTKAAVYKLQAGLGVSQTGNFWNLTRAALNAKLGFSI